MIAVSWGRVGTPKKGLHAPPPAGFEALRERLHLMAEDVCAKRGVTLPQILGARQTKDIVRVRDEIFWTAQKETGASLIQIARAFNCGSYTTVRRGAQRHAKRDCATPPISTFSTDCP